MAVHHDPEPRRGEGTISNELLGACPLCGQVQRVVLHEDIGDNTFFAVQGHWSLWRCLGCSCVYLDPRPTRETIAFAYRNYYTHEEATKPRYEELPPLRKVRRRFVNGYIHWRYGANLRPRSLWGRWVALLLPPLRRIIDFDYRHLPPGDGGGRALLDVGCGSGNFLALAMECGWEALGVDPDPAAVAEARLKGVSVQLGGLESYARQEGRFDVITMHHVIEHFHDPVGALRDCHRLLKPGGMLWLVTPNIDSFGHARFGRFWRGLEAPRHLVLFNECSLLQVLESVGFTSWRRLCAPSAHPPLVQASYAMTQGRSPDDPSVVLPVRLRVAAAMKSWAERIRPARREFLFMAVTK